ncbi:MAG: CDP-diacylglycerol--serine O-phosphatidyltransferase [Acidobacteria bacterium]|nr:MAG: CDP-diacylglycerol--serine O-phosphatidyltransferase [Acidobacteriota bacterium]
MDDAELLPPRSWIPSTVTAASMTSGFASMLLAASDRFEPAVYCLLAAIFLDILDGRLARRLHATSRFGQELDSFGDALSFGVAPALLIYQAILYQMGPAGAVVALAYLLAGIYRLVRFNLQSDAHRKSRRTTGVPIPFAASYLMTATLMREQLTPLWTTLLVLFMAFAMTSRWRLPDLKGKNVVSAMLLVGLLLFVFVVLRPSWQTVIWWSAWNLLILLAAKLQDRHLARATAGS